MREQQEPPSTDPPDGESLEPQAGSSVVPDPEESMSMEDVEAARYRESENFFEVVNADLDLEERPVLKSEGRYATPERNPAVKRG